MSRSEDSVFPWEHDCRSGPGRIPLAPPSWPAEGLCAQTDPAMFLVKKGGSNKDAKKVCGLCDMREECLEWALYVDEPNGVWGGLGPNERKALKRAAA